MRLEQEFCDDPNVLTNDINALYTDDMTSLYDALYTAVERVATQTGANVSSLSPMETITIVTVLLRMSSMWRKRYHIPVFIIGIGSVNSNDPSQIAAQTGGAYYNINTVDSMQSIYDEIYQMEKELYLVEFEDNTGATVKDTAQIEPDTTVWNTAENAAILTHRMYCLIRTALPFIRMVRKQL